MKIEKVPFTITDWQAVHSIEYPGESGTSFWRVFEQGNIRVRMVEYKAGFFSDHYCSRGHVLLVLDGELKIKLKNGEEYTLKKGMSFQAGDDEENPHLAYTDSGATVFLVD